MDGWNNLSKSTVEIFNNFYAQANILINGLRLKQKKSLLGKEAIKMYFVLLTEFAAEVESFKKIETGQDSYIR